MRMINKTELKRLVIEAILNFSSKIHDLKNQTDYLEVKERHELEGKMDAFNAIAQALNGDPVYLHMLAGE